MSPPVVFLIFNRPDVTARVFAAIRDARPRRLLVVADGPRPDRPGERERCAETRRIIEGVDWPCEVLRDFSDVNLGCGRRISSGLGWAFGQVDEAIVLEDDCLPHPSFFRFCGEMLERYRGDERVMMISGDNFQHGRRHGDASYYFSRYHHIWGWATWRRAWCHYDFSLAEWPALDAQGWLDGITPDWPMRHFWRSCFDAVAAGRIDTWDYQWLYTAWRKGGLSIAPNSNLVTNIGFGAGATHTTQLNERLLPPVAAMDFPLHHLPAVAVCRAADAYEERQVFMRPKSRLKLRLRRLLGRLDR